MTPTPPLAGRRQVRRTLALLIGALLVVLVCALSSCCLTDRLPRRAPRSLEEAQRQAHRARMRSYYTPRPK
ncbi:hypothetical protein [uncultured Hymenobacter sp.]|uniref:hypothetical protein n=1 Tax=uncultured Hymenobacter sp. TaxID=170016 RepID=UPI0035CA2CFA